MKAVILAGGFGTRIRDVTQDIPKPMIPIGHRPILWHIMKTYAHHQVKDFIVCLGYKSEDIKNYFMNYNQNQNDLTLDLKTGKVIFHGDNVLDDWRITFAQTGLNSGTAERIYRIRDYLQGDDYFMLTYGDGVGSIDIQALLEFHKAHGKIVTVTGVRPPGRFGDLDIDGDQVIGFNEKPQAHDGRISAGYFVCNKKVFDYLSDYSQDQMFEREPLNNIVRDNQLMIYRHDGFWMPMDTSRDYNYLNDLWRNDNAPWKV
ncbi:MAG: glucose-1-phosphate cytidylyltransferase [Alphaproteobacteria bacterium]|nr:MAG: glucose-1-phosphate cytidylyltransferase [Alphaproteobacteria bacterium]